MLLIELAVILVAAKLSGDLASRWGQPPVLGQLVAGLALGVSYSLLQPGADLPQGPEINAIAQLGVILLMFLAGLETDWHQLRATGKAATIAACAGVAVPLLAGWATGRAFGLGNIEALFVGVILTATSVSITAQTLMELGSLRTLAGATILGAAIIDDVIGLLVFSFAIAFTGAATSNLALVFIPLGAFFVLAYFFGERALTWVVSRSERLQGGEAALGMALAAAFVLAFVAERSGIAAITGAYLAGLLINREERFEGLVEKIRVIGYGFFVPIFLVKTGMDARIEQLGSAALFVIALTIVAIGTKIVGSGAGAKVAGLTTRQSIIVGVGMVSRGEVAIIVAGLALAAGAITPAIFSASLVVVVATTVATPPLLRLALRGVDQQAAEAIASASRVA